MYPTEIVERFWAKVALCAHGRTCASCCWEWQGGKVRGYGSACIYWRSSSAGPHHYQTKRAHRMSWEIVHGPIPHGLWVLHDCPHGDNPLCVNTAHLWLGTPDDNQKDSMRKGRRPTGDAHGLRLHPGAAAHGAGNAATKLTPEQVSWARAKHQAGWSYRKIAEALPVTRHTIRAVMTGKTWKHLP
jgi:HNH endonuclease